MQLPKNLPVYAARKPAATDLYRIFSTHYNLFRSQYEKYENKYGFFRFEIDAEYEKYMRCGIVRHGYALLKCGNADCGNKMLLAFSCKSRSLCISCMQKHMLVAGIEVTENVLTMVPHRHIVFTIPVLLRKSFFWNRKSLNDLSRLAWNTLKDFYSSLTHYSGTPGAVLSIETSGEYQDVNPHIHALVSDGLFFTNGTFVLSSKITPKELDVLKKLWQQKVADYCLKKNYIRPENIKRVLAQRHTGFSVFVGNRIEWSKHNPSGKEAIAQLVRYIHKPCVSAEKITLAENGKVLYHGSFHQGKKRNFEIFEPEDFIAALTSHVPNRRQKYVNHYGWYSNKNRGLRLKNGTEKQPEIAEGGCAGQKAITWARLMQMVWEINPLKCPNCGGTMKVVTVVVPESETEPRLTALPGPAPPADEIVYESTGEGQEPVDWVS